jgi:hypothetical protein
MPSKVATYIVFDMRLRQGIITYSWEYELEDILL